MKQPEPEKGVNPGGDIELVYRECLSRGRRSFVAHRVVKKTAEYLYFDRTPYDPSKPDSGCGRLESLRPRTARLHREMLAMWGHLPVSGFDESPCLVYARLPTDELEQDVPACLMTLGLTYQCTEHDVRQAYRRRARQSHPDAGGNDAEFIVLRKAYEEALSLVGGTP